MRTLALLLLLLASPAAAGTLKLGWTWPATDADGFPMTDLDHGTVYATRCNALGDTLKVAVVPATGKEGRADSVDVQLPDGSVGWVWMTATDHSGNESQVASWASFAFPALAAPTGGPGLLASLYDNVNLVEPPVAQRVDATVNYTWGSGSAWSGGPVDGFSIRWDGYVTLPVSGPWRFYVTSDDGRRLFVDGSLVIDYWQPTWSEGSWAGTLSAGVHAIRLEYFEGGGGALCQLSWVGPDGARSTIPASALSH